RDSALSPTRRSPDLRRTAPALQHQHRHDAVRVRAVLVDRVIVRWPWAGTLTFDDAVIAVPFPEGNTWQQVVVDLRDDGDIGPLRFGVHAPGRRDREFFEVYLLAVGGLLDQRETGSFASVVDRQCVVREERLRVREVRGRVVRGATA